MNTITAKLALCLITSVFFLGSSIAQACQFHNEFGGSRWSPYRHINPADYAYGPKLTLDTPRMVSAALGQKTKVTVKYAYSPSNGEGSTVQLLIDGGPSVSIVDKSKVRVQGDSGEHTFTIVPAVSGTYRLVVTASDADQSDFTLSREVIYVSVSA